MLSPDEIVELCKRKGWSYAYAGYAAAHPYCEACELGSRVPAEAPHHIRTRGAHGNIDEPWNLLSLCWNHHYNEIHVMGPRRFAEKYPHLREKIEAALSRRIPLKKGIRS